MVESSPDGTTYLFKSNSTPRRIFTLSMGVLTLMFTLLPFLDPSMPRPGAVAFSLAFLFLSFLYVWLGTLKATISIDTRSRTWNIRRTHLFGRTSVQGDLSNGTVVIAGFDSTSGTFGGSSGRPSAWIKNDPGHWQIGLDSRPITTFGQPLASREDEVNICKACAALWAAKLQLPLDDRL